MPSQETILRAAISYGWRGWKVLPLAGPNDPGNSPGKRPLIQAWHKMASSDEAQIEEWWRRWPDANVGVKFGPESDLIDLECDKPEEEEALAALFGGEFPETPTFMSSRGKHRLFRFHPDLPTADSKGIVYVGGVGFRTGGAAKGAQSVFPPSVHKSGSVYQWLIHPDQVEVASLPDLVIAKIANNEGNLFSEREAAGRGKPKEYWDSILQHGLDEGNRNQGAAELIGKMLSELKDPFDSAATNRLWMMISQWNTINRPPIPAAELDRTFQSILKAERDKSLTREYRESFNRYVDLPLTQEPPAPAPTEPAGDPPAEGATQEPGVTAKPFVTPQTRSRNAWRMVKVDGKPVIWQLYSPLWEGYVELSSDELMSNKKISLVALEQKMVVLGADFRHVWNGTKKEEGLLSKLVRIAEVVEAAPEQHRDVIVAEVVLAILDRCPASDDPSPRGSPVQRPDGTLWFKVTQLHAMAKSDLDSVNFGEMSSLLRSAGATDARWRNASTVHTFKVLSPKALRALRKIARCDPAEGG